jgi:hypothetical protein
MQSIIPNHIPDEAPFSPIDIIRMQEGYEEVVYSCSLFMSESIDKSLTNSWYMWCKVQSAPLLIVQHLSIHNILTVQRTNAKLKLICKVHHFTVPFTHRTATRERKGTWLPWRENNDLFASLSISYTVYLHFPHCKHGKLRTANYSENLCPEIYPAILHIGDLTVNYFTIAVLAIKSFVRVKTVIP